MAKNFKNTAANVNNKRQRHDADGAKAITRPNISKPPPSATHDKKGGNMSYDVGHGAKSAVHMKAVAPNRFILLHHPETDGPLKDKAKDITNCVDMEMSTSPVVVPETQPPCENMMAT